MVYQRILAADPDQARYSSNRCRGCRRISIMASIAALIVLLAICVCAPVEKERIRTNTLKDQIQELSTVTDVKVRSDASSWTRGELRKLLQDRRHSAEEKKGDIVEKNAVSKKQEKLSAKEEQRKKAKHYEDICTIASPPKELPNATKAIESLFSLWWVAVGCSLVYCLVWFCENSMDGSGTDNVYEQVQKSKPNKSKKNEESSASGFERVVVAVVLILFSVTPLTGALDHPQSSVINSTQVMYTIHIPALVQTLSAPVLFVLVKMMLLDRQTALKEIQGKVPASRRLSPFGEVDRFLACCSFLIGPIVLVMGFMELEAWRSDPIGFMEQSLVHVFESSAGLCMLGDLGQNKSYLFASGHGYKSGELGSCYAFDNSASAQAIATIFLGRSSMILYVVGMLAFTLGEVMKLRPQQKSYLRRIFPHVFPTLMRQRSALAQLTKVKAFQRSAFLATWSVSPDSALEAFKRSAFTANSFRMEELYNCARRSERFKCGWSGLLQSLGAVLIVPFFRVQKTPCFGFDASVDASIFAGTYDVGNTEQFFHMVRYASLGVVSVLMALSCIAIAIHSLPGRVQISLHAAKVPIGSDLTDAAANAMAVCIIIFLIVFGADLPFEVERPEPLAWKELWKPRCFLVTVIVAETILRFFIAIIIPNRSIAKKEIQDLKDNAQDIVEEVNKYVQRFGSAEVKKVAQKAIDDYVASNPDYEDSEDDDTEDPSGPEEPPNPPNPHGRGGGGGGGQQGTGGRHTGDRSGSDRPMPRPVSIRAWKWLADDMNVAEDELASHLAQQSDVFLSAAKSDFPFDEIVKEIATHCPQLHTIELGGTRVTDQGVQALARGCPNLQSIELGGCRAVTGIGVQELTANIPGIKIWR